MVKRIAKRLLGQRDCAAQSLKNPRAGTPFPNPTAFRVYTGSTPSVLTNRVSLRMKTLIQVTES